jgi:hypothetical protein
MDMDTLEIFLVVLSSSLFRELIVGKSLKPILSRILTGRFALAWKMQRSSVFHRIDMRRYSFCGMWNLLREVRCKITNK